MVESLREDLRSAVREQSERGLHSSSKWCAEQLVGLSSSPAAGAPANAAAAPAAPADDGDATDALLLSRSYFQMREYMRASHVLEETPGHKARFLRLYALYLAGERRKDDQMLEESTNLADSYPAHVCNQQLKPIDAELTALHEADELDGYALYLYAVVLKQLQRLPQALELLCAALHKEPTLWAAWLEVAAACPDRDAVARLSLPDHWMVHFFYAHVCLELQQNAEAVTLYERLAGTFPASTYVLAQLATAHYQLREFDEAQARFEELLAADPYRLDHVDTYSNILYVKESKRALSYVAHNAVAVDKYRPETCCIVGNYYSLRAEHEKAVLYFQRALRLDRSYLSAWTLMGHEYVELKNTGAAIHAYRQAVEISPRDYRAWYALGQTYEILQMPFYALFYYRKATALRPYDARMWSALAGCYRLLNRRAEVRGRPRAARKTRRLRSAPLSRCARRRIRCARARAGHPLLRARRVERRPRGDRAPGARAPAQRVGQRHAGRGVLRAQPGAPRRAAAGGGGHDRGAQVPRGALQAHGRAREGAAVLRTAPRLRRAAGRARSRECAPLRFRTRSRAVRPARLSRARTSQDVEEAKAMLREIRSVMQHQQRK